jgi:hypothetical protein
VTVSVLNGEDGMPAATFTKNGSTSDWADATAYFTTGAAGNYVLTLANSGNTWMTNVSLVKVASAEFILNETEKYEPMNRVYYENVKLNRSIKAGINTLVLPFDMTQEEVEDKFGADSKVYTVSSYDAASNNISFTSASGISANEPCILKADQEGSSYEIPGRVFVNGTTEYIRTDVKMVGSYEASTPIEMDANNYIISDGKLYLVDSDNVTMKNTRAYINITAENEVKVLNMTFDGVATRISDLNGMAAENDAIYNLAGQRVNNAQKGIYIVNGKKVIK